MEFADLGLRDNVAIAAVFQVRLLHLRSLPAPLKDSKRT